MSLTIIGFGKVTTKDLGETGLEQPCVWCSARVVYHLVLVRTWFTYFFIPVIPYRKAYRVTCPVCGGAVAISGEEVKAAKRGELTLRRG
jgi:zinc-ribbon family